MIARMDLPNYLGVALVKAREVAGMTQAEAAFYAKTTDQSLSKFENGLRIPSDDKLWEIAKALDADYRKLKKAKERTIEDRDGSSEAA